jgi:hypothetical protein
LNWEELPKPWTKEQCRQRYVESGDDIGIRGLANLSGLNKGTVERWVRNEDWVRQRRQYCDRLKASTQEKTIEKASERLSDELADISVANYKAHKLARDYAYAIFQIKAKHLKKIQQLPDGEQLGELKKHSGNDMNYWSLILARSTQEIAAATGLPYFVNANTAFKKLEMEGFVVLDPRVEIEEEDE